jgi:hypothetical protein
MKFPWLIIVIVRSIALDERVRRIISLAQAYDPARIDRNAIHKVKILDYVMELCLPVRQLQRVEALRCE